MKRMKSRKRKSEKSLQESVIAWSETIFKVCLVAAHIYYLILMVLNH